MYGKNLTKHNHFIQNRFVLILVFLCDSREEVWTDEEPCTLEDLSADIITWSGYQNLCRDKGEVAGAEIIQEFISRYVSLMV